MIHEAHLLPAFFKAAATAMELIADREQRFQSKNSLFTAVLSCQQAEEEKYNNLYVSILKDTQELLSTLASRVNATTLGMHFATEMRTLLERELKERFGHERFVPFGLTRGDTFALTTRWVELLIHGNSQLDSEDQHTPDELELLKGVLYARCETDCPIKELTPAAKQLDAFLSNAKEQLIAYGARKKSLGQFVVRNLVDLLQKSATSSQESQFLSSLFLVYKLARDGLFCCARQAKTAVIEPVENVNLGNLVVAISAVKKIAENQLVQIGKDETASKLHIALTHFLQLFKERPFVWNEEIKTLGSFRIRRAARSLSVGGKELKRSTTARSFATHCSPLVKSSSSSPELPMLDVDEAEGQRLALSDASGRSHTWPKDSREDSPKDLLRESPRITDARSDLGLTSPRQPPKEAVTVLIEELLATLKPFI